MLQERSQFEQKITILEQEILTKTVTIEKYEQEIYEWERKEDEGVRLQQSNYFKDLEK